MAINLLHYSTGNDDPTWGVVRGNTVLPLPGQYATTADVLDQGADAARTLLAESGKPGIPLAGVTPLNPGAGARVVCQGANYQAHIAESGMDPNRPYNLLFTKSSGSLTGARDDIVAPSHVKLLDYEIELGIVIGKAITAPTLVSADNAANTSERSSWQTMSAPATSSCRKVSSTKARAIGRSAPLALTCASPTQTK